MRASPGVGPGRSGSRPVVLIVGRDARSGLAIERLVKEAAGITGLVGVRHVERLPCGDLNTFAALLFATPGPTPDLQRLGDTHTLATRSRVILNLASTPRDQLWTISRHVPLQILLVGTPLDDQRACASLREVLIGDPAARALEPLLGRICTSSQADLILAFVRTTGARSPGAVARAASRSRRSLTRDCSRLGVAPPQRLLQVGRVSRALWWLHTYEVSAAEAAWVAAYGQPGSLRRAALQALGAPLAVLQREWSFPERLAARYQRAVLR